MICKYFSHFLALPVTLLAWNLFDLLTSLLTFILSFERKAQLWMSVVLHGREDQNGIGWLLMRRKMEGGEEARLNFWLLSRWDKWMTHKKYLKGVVCFDILLGFSLVYAHYSKNFSSYTDLAIGWLWNKRNKNVTPCLKSEKLNLF